MRRDRTGIGGSLYTLVGAQWAIDGLDELARQAPRALATLVRHCTEKAKAQAVADAPQGKTGLLKQHIFTKYFDEQTTGVVFVSGRIRDPSKKKARGRKYPRWIEFGTTKMTSRPYLLPAGKSGWREMQDLAPKLIERFVKEAE